MKLYTVQSEGLSHNSYMLVDGLEAAVVDPRRDCHIYTRIAKRNCTQIRYVFETHRNEDYVVGSKELATLTEAEICHGKQLNFAYGDHRVEDGDTFSVGNLKIIALHTPGHTNESFCYTVSDTAKSADPLMAFTGDTLFVGAIGRTDLQGKNNQPTQAEKLFASIREKLLPLGNGTFVYPSHGAGSVCGSGIGEQAYSTIGYERKTNPYLNLDKDQFVVRATTQEMIVPMYFKKMEEYNLRGAPTLRGLPEPRALIADEFASCTEEADSTVVDTRLPYAFSGSHIPNALSLWLGGGTAVYTGWILGYDLRLLLVTERKADVARVQRHFWRQGFDNVYGFLCRGMNHWQEEGKPISHVHTLSASALKGRRDHYVVLDVREPSEWHTDGVIEGAEQIFFADLPTEADRLNRNRRIAVTCSVGNRASTAASVLERKGFQHVSNVLGGMTAWNELGFPTVKTKREEYPIAY